MAALLTNAECGPVTPLAQLQKHADTDRSLQLDRVAGPSPARLQKLPSTLTSSVAQGERDAAARFFAAPSDNRALQFQPSQLQVQRLPGPSHWAAEFSGLGPSRALPRDSHVFKEMEAALLRAENEHLAQIPLSSWALEFPSSTGASALHPPLQAPFFRNAEPVWDQAFARLATQYPLLESKGKERAVLDDAELEDAFARASLSVGTSQVKSEERDYQAELENVWNQVRADSAIPSSQADLTQWEAEFNASRAQENEELDGFEFDLEEIEKQYKDLTERNMFADDDSRLLRYDDDGFPDLGDYEFEQDNPYLSILTSASLPSLLEQSLASTEPSSLTRSALILEAMIQLGTAPASSSFQLWYTLGQVLCRDERDVKGIKAVIRAVKESDGREDGKAAVLELAIAYVNQQHDLACFVTLLRFLHLSYPNHPGLPDPAQFRGQATWSVRDAITEVYLSLAREQHESGSVDPDVQTGLGVLLYSGGQFDKAADCFQAALAINPENAVLWNRLGSCLSNGNRPEEAIRPYQRALEIWPNYTRAVVNVGVACLNMGAYREAAEHLLSAISMHDGSGSRSPLRAIPQGVRPSDDIWKTLRRVFMAMKRPDLEARAAADDRSADAFRGEGFEF